MVSRIVLFTLIMSIMNVECVLCVYMTSSLSLITSRAEMHKPDLYEIVDFIRGDSHCL